MILHLDGAKAPLFYNPETGIFVWTAPPRRGVSAGRAGRLMRSGYRKIGKFAEHRLVYLVMTGQSPVGDIDHINGKRDDNRWSNLRLATRSQNMENLKRSHADNTTGWLGVSKKRGRYFAEITKNGKKIRLGAFGTGAEAHAAYLAAKKVVHLWGTL